MAEFLSDLELETKIHNYLNDSKKISKTINRSLDFIFCIQMDNLLTETIEITSEIFQESYKKEFHNKIFESIEIENILVGKSLSEYMEEGTTQELTDFIASYIIKPRKELFYQILNQDSMKEIFASIVENAIIEFNKKYNPLFDAFFATGIHKQIKSFVYMFLPEVLNKVINYLYDNARRDSNKTFIKDTAIILMNSTSENYHTFSEEDKKKLFDNIQKIKERFQDDIVIKQKLIESYTNIRNHIVNHHGKETLKEFLCLNDTEYNQLKKKLSKQVLDNFAQFQKNNPMNSVLKEFIKDVLK